MKYITASEAAEIFGVNHSRILALCRQGRIVGAVKQGKKQRAPWAIPYPVKITKAPLRSDLPSKIKPRVNT